MHPKHLKIADFTYHLPEEKIATYPLEKRDDSKLLVYKNSAVTETVFNHLADYISANSLLVFNNSKVIEARLLFKKESGGLIEIFVLEPYKLDVSTAMQTQGNIDCLCLVGGAKKWKGGKIRLLKKDDRDNLHAEDDLIFEAEMLEKKGEAYLIRFNWQPFEKTFAEVLHTLGQIPIPPYLNRPADNTDKERYQTIYAKADGSVAAPTAGLHFTPIVLANLTEKNIATAYATLHVGAGTFRPVKSETIEGHEMHAEYIDVDIAFIKTLMQFDKITPVGTTSMRTIESIYWMGLKTFVNPTITIEDLEIKQWEIYNGLMEQAVEKNIALQALLNWLNDNGLPRLIIQTQILIAPSYKTKIATGLITNFHQPNSTLLLLVAALVGNDWKKIYDYALQHEFRFLSYGDSSFLEFGKV
jgi:S-adenosylmethionine:tRNA ribosyltransferase-isomerase